MIPLRDSQPSYSTPVVTLGLIAVNVFVFLYQVSLDPFSLNHFIFSYGVVPEQLNLATLVTSMFLHGGWLHLIGNMWTLWLFGCAMESRLGSLRFLAFYLLSGVAAGIVHVPHARIVTLIFVFVFVTTIEVPAFLILIYWFAIQLFSGVGSIGYSAASGGTAWFAHIGGFVAGLGLIFILGTRPRYRRHRELQW